MDIAFRSRISADSIYNYSQVVLIVLFLSAALFFVLATPTVVMQKGANALEASTPVEKLLAGPLALRADPRSPMALSLEKNLMLTAMALRPGMEKKLCRIGIRGTDHLAEITESDEVFLKVTGDELEFSAEPTGLILRADLMDMNAVTLQLEGEVEGPVQVVLQKRGMSLGEAGSEVAILGAMNWWGQDLLYRYYGGSDYADLAKKEKIRLFEGETPYILFVEKGDFLYFSSGRWVVASSLGDVDSRSILAQILDVSSSAIAIEVWDEHGFTIFDNLIRRAPNTFVNAFPKDMITEPKMRTTNQFSCKLGKKHTILRKDDWMLKEGDTWKKLRTKEDLEAYLTHEKMGELFVIDLIEPSGKIKGSYLDATRTLASPFYLQAITSKKPETKGRKRK